MASKTNKTGATDSNFFFYQPTDSINMSLKLLIDTKQQRVVYAEAGKDFVDFLFNIPLFPLGAVMKLLSQQRMVGSLGNLQSSIENFSDTHMQEQKKENLLNPKLLNLGKNEQVLLPDVKASSFNTFYACTTCLNFAADNKDTWCPNNGCSSYMKLELKFVERPWKSSTPIGGEQGGYVKGATYMITDDLEVKPLSTFTSLILLKKFKVDVVGGLDERVVNLGKDEGMKLLNASLHSSTVLLMYSWWRTVGLKLFLDLRREKLELEDESSFNFM